MKQALFIAAILLLPIAAHGQTPSSAVVVQTCGTPPNTYVPNQTTSMTMDTGGKLCDSGGGGGGGSNPAAGATGSAVPADASYNGLNVGGTLRGQTGVNPSGSVEAGQNDVTSVNGVTVLTGAGATGTGSQRVTEAQDTTTIAGSAPGTAGTPSTNVVSVQGVSGGTGIPLAPTTSGGLSIKRLQVANNTTSVAIDASPGQLYGIEAFNNSSVIAYVKLYNASQGSTTCGSGTPVYQGMIPAASSGGAGYVSMNGYGAPFSTAITACITTGFADNDTTAPAASAYVLNVFYK